jgi:TatD DNase family protein
MELIDTHCHIDVEDFDEDREAVLAHCREAGITRMIVPAVMANTWDHLATICAKSAGLYPAYGLHPVYTDHHSDSDLLGLEKRLRDSRPVGVGEIGLDFYYKKDLSEEDRNKQLTLFDAQLGLAQENNLPVVLHVRKAHDAVLMALRRTPVVGGICHAFNGSLEQAHRYIDMGFKLGFGGMLTYERSHKLHRLARELPIDSLVLETDAPDMTVASHHGERNSPEYLPECLAALAETRGKSMEYIAEHTTKNAKSIFSFD